MSGRASRRPSRPSSRPSRPAGRFTPIRAASAGPHGWTSASYHRAVDSPSDPTVTAESGSIADPRRPRRTGSSRARRGVDRGLQPAVPHALSPPVELGLGVHRARPLVVRPAARPAGARDALPRAVGERDGAPHRVQPVGRGGRLLPGSGVLAVVDPIAARPARRRDVRDHAADHPRPCGTRDPPPRARSGRVDRVPALAVPAPGRPAPLHARCPTTGRDPPRGHGPSVGVRARQLAGLGSRP